MLSSELHPIHDSLALIKNVLPEHNGSEEQIKHLREILSDNVIISGWINCRQESNSPQALIADLRERVEKFEANQHLREIEGQALEDNRKLAIEPGQDWRSLN